MLTHTHRLRSKDVRFLTKKRHYFTKGWFGFFYVPQYPNRKYNQFSFHVSIKLSKHATQRNKIKRLIMNYLRDTDAVSLAIGGNFYKVFIVLNKKMLEQLPSIEIRSSESEWRIAQFQESFTSFKACIGTKK